MPHRLTFLVGLGCACSNGTSASDSGTPDVVTQDVTVNDAAPDGASLTVPQALDQAGKLALWLEATSTDIVLVDGGSVITWKDKSKNKNDAAALGTSPYVEKGVIVGHDAVHFDTYTTTLTVADATSLQFGTDPVYIAAVAKVLTLRSFFFGKFDGGASYTGLSFFTGPSGTNFPDGGFSIPALYMWFDTNGDQFTWSGAELGDGKFHIESFRRLDATNVALALDDLTPQTKAVAAIDIGAQGMPLQIGPIGGPTPPDFSLVEELVVHAPSDADVTDVHAYLKQKYGL